jgi:hypothetical protein
MPDTPPSLPTPVPLAQAFLALGDNDAAAPERPSPVLVVAVIAATIVLALAAPLAWASAPGQKLSDQPAATAPSKAAVPAPDDDVGDGTM